jgi:hypothetical protein
MLGKTTMLDSHLDKDEVIGLLFVQRLCQLNGPYHIMTLPSCSRMAKIHTKKLRTELARRQRTVKHLG